jgi:hypothetical protein
MAEKSNTEKRENACILCGSKSEEKVLLCAEQKGKTVWVCVECLPVLVHPKGGH